MPVDFCLLLLVTFLAATLQAATGFGFGLVGVTFFLILLHSASVVHIVIIVTFVISLCHWWKIRHQAPRDLVKKMMIGCCVGYPIGIVLFQSMSLAVLKMAVALLILLMCVQNIGERIYNRRAKTDRLCSTKPSRCAFIGLISGIMTSTLAMPGPVVIAYLTRCDITKDQTRATVITCSAASYGIVLLLQAGLVGFSKDTLDTALVLLPAALLGTVLGDYISRFIHPTWFKNITLLVLVISGLNMLFHIDF